MKTLRHLLRPIIGGIKVKCNECGVEVGKTWISEAHLVTQKPPIVFCNAHGKPLGKWTR